jgi:tripartite-type tricarboxylate transporter receptor subunit TctC
MLATVPSVMGQVKAGKLRAVATTSGRRLPMLPDIPTVSESGLPGYEMSPWMGMWGPARLPRPIVEQANRALAKVLTMPDVRDQFLQQGLDETGEPIGIKRLEARPIATLCLEAQERHERKERTIRDD